MRRLSRPTSVCCALLAFASVASAQERPGLRSHGAQSRPEVAQNGGDDPQAQQALAELVDHELAEGWRDQKLKPAAPSDDATWLRRLCLDLCGTIPEREEVEQFLDDARPDKRARKIAEYLDDRAFAENLSFLWNNALLAAAQKSPERGKLRPWLEEQFAAHVPFADVTRELIAGAGESDQNGALAYPIAYNGEIESLSAVTARVFLGVQIQCAQCHDHPFDKWKREDFNGFTGFFVGMRANKTRDADGMQVFRVVDVNPEQERKDALRKLTGFIRKQAGKGGDDPEEKDEMMEMRARARRGEDPLKEIEEDPQRLEKLLASLPGDVREKVEKFRERERLFGNAQFLDGKPYEPNELLSKRAALAEWTVAPENPWFAKAVVNRMWDHLFGKGLVEPVDDLTSSKDQVLPQVLGTLAQEFTKHGTDLRFLMGAMVRTKAYALGNTLAHDEGQRDHEERWFAAHPLRPFTAEQVLHALLRATATDVKKVGRARGPAFDREQSRLLERFKYYFSDDEGGEGDTFLASIPQSLFLMNGKYTNDDVRLQTSKMLQAILDETRGDRERLRQIFLAALGRLPSTAEAERLGRLTRGAKGGNVKGIEDLFWALLNSTEFHTNH